MAQQVKNPPSVQGDVGLIPGVGRRFPEEGSDSLSIFAWEIP